MGRFVIVAYMPKPGCESQLLAVLGKHMEVLHKEGLVTDRPAYVMHAQDGSILEVFEWRSAQAIQAAHGNAAVQTLWQEFAEVCQYKPISDLEETRQLFAEFDAIDP